MFNNIWEKNLKFYIISLSFSKILFLLMLRLCEKGLFWKWELNTEVFDVFVNGDMGMNVCYYFLVFIDRLLGNVRFLCFCIIVLVFKNNFMVNLMYIILNLIYVKRWVEMLLFFNYIFFRRK